jgi:hypothetical protein
LLAEYQTAYRERRVSRVQYGKRVRERPLFTPVLASSGASKGSSGRSTGS